MWHYKKKKKDYIIMKVTNDKYELPVDFYESWKEMSIRENKPIDHCYSLVCRNKYKTLDYGKYKYVRVELEEDDI